MLMLPELDMANSLVVKLPTSDSDALTANQTKNVLGHQGQKSTTKLRKKKTNADLFLKMTKLMEIDHNFQLLDHRSLDTIVFLVRQVNDN